MPRPVAVVLLATACLGMLGGCSALRRPKPIGGPFAPYPNTPAFAAVVDVHKQAGDDPRDELVLLTTWFLDGDPRVAMMCRVTPTGHVSRYRYTYDESVRPSPLLTLVPNQMSSLTEAIAQLPPSQQPPLENLLIVSFRQDGVWTTRTYDRTAPPQPLINLFTLTAAPLQPDPRLAGSGEG